MGPDLKLLVREVPGRRVKDRVSNVTTFKRNDDCGRVKCFPCTSGSRPGSKGQCWKSGPTYQIKCERCDYEDGVTTLYAGKSGFSASTRGGTHLEGLRAEDHRSILWDHAVHHHGCRAGESCSP